MRITIIQSRMPAKQDVNEKIKWFSHSLGLFNMRDRDSSCYRVFIEVLKSSRENRALSSDEIAYRLSLSRGTVVHHMNKLMESGIVVPEHRRYILRVSNLAALVEELQKDVWRSLEELKKAANEIDKELRI